MFKEAQAHNGVIFFFMPNDDTPEQVELKMKRNRVVVALDLLGEKDLIPATLLEHLYGDDEPNPEIWKDYPEIQDFVRQYVETGVFPAFPEIKNPSPA